MRKSVIEQASAATALVNNIFKSRTTQIWVTVEEIALGTRALQACHSRGEAAQRLMNIFNDSIALTLMFRTSLALSLISFVMRNALDCLSSRDAFQKGNWIEGVSDLINLGVRLAPKS
jgi:hypothetical protein